MTLLVGCVAAAVPAFADGMIDAKMQCRLAYGPSSEIGTACEHGVDLASGVPDDVEKAIDGCMRDTKDGQRAAACQRGVMLYARFAGRVREGDKRSFSHTWQQGRGGAEVDVGDYELHVGDAEKSIEDCLRASEGSSMPPSCLSGITVQHKPPGDVSPK